MQLKLSERARDWLMVLPVGASYLVMRQLMQDERAFAFAVCGGVFYVLVSREWEKRRRAWFWLTILAFAIVNIVIISFVRFPQYHGPSLISIPFMFVDGFLMWGILNFIERRLSASGDEGPS